MRKRIVMAAIAVVVIGVGAFVISERKRRSVEYHAGAYLKGYRPGKGTAWVLARVPDPWARTYLEWRYRRVDGFHREALVRAGYFSYGVYVISNRVPDGAVAALPWVLSDRGIRFGWRIYPDGTWGERAYPLVELVDERAIRVLVLSNDIGKVDAVIRKFDVQEIVDFGF